MHSYSLSLGGSYTDTNLLTGVSTTVLTTKFEHNLIVTAASSGNFKDPTTHRYSTLSVTRLHGERILTNSSGTPTRLWQGDLGILVPDLSANLTSEAREKALGKLYDKWRGELDLAVDIAEAHQAKAMVGKYFKGLHSFSGIVSKIQDTARALRRARRDPTKIVSNMWLEWTYGWKPLASSIYGTFDEMFRVRPYRIRAKAQAREVKRVNVATGVNGIVDQCISENSSRCLMDVYFKPPATIVDSLSGYTSLNPIGIAWELVPYSFVVDWFLDIGGYIRNLESAYLSRNSFVKGYTTLTYRNTTTVVRKGSSSDPGIKTIWNATGNTVNGFKDRTPLGASPFPRPPSLKVDLGSSRLLSAAALLRQRIPRQFDLRVKPIKVRYTE